MELICGRIWMESDGSGILSCDIDTVRNVHVVRDTSGKAAREVEDGPAREVATLTVAFGSPAHREICWNLDNKKTFADINPGLAWVVRPSIFPQEETWREAVEGVTMECVVA